MEDLKKRMGVDEDKPIPADFNIPYFVHQEDMYHVQVHAKRWFVAWLVTFILLVVVCLSWSVKEALYEDVVITEATQDGGGTNIITGRDLDYGSESKDNQN